MKLKLSSRLELGTRNDSTLPTDGSRQWTLGALVLTHRRRVPQPAPTAPVGPRPRVPAPVIERVGGAIFGDFARDHLSVDPALLNPPPAVTELNVPPQARITSFAGLPGLGPDAADKLMRNASTMLRVMTRGGSDPVRLASSLKKTALSLVPVLAQLDHASRNNALRWLQAYLGAGRKHANGAVTPERIEALRQQVPVWEQLIDHLSALRQDRASQYRVLLRLWRETEVPRGTPTDVAAQVTTLLGSVRQRLQALLPAGHGIGTPLGENTHALARSLVQRLGGAVPASAQAREGTVAHALVSMEPLSEDAAKAYRNDLAEHLEYLQHDRRSDENVREPMLYSLGKRFPGLNIQHYQTQADFGKFLKDFPGESGLLFGLISHGGAHHAVAMVAKRTFVNGQPRTAAWFLDSGQGTYNKLLAEEYNTWSTAKPGRHAEEIARPDSGMITSLEIQEDPHSCGTMAMSALVQSFLNYDRTDTLLDRLLAGDKVGNSYVETSQPNLQFTEGADPALAAITPAHLKHMQDKDETGRLRRVVGVRPEHARMFVNGSLQTVEQRYRAPGNLQEVQRKDHQLPQMHSGSAERTFQRWRQRAMEDLRELMNLPDAGAAQWREACTRMAAYRMRDGTVSDRVAGGDVNKEIGDDWICFQMADVFRLFAVGNPREEAVETAVSKTLKHFRDGK
jgi:hypothetical protein